MNYDKETNLVGACNMRSKSFENVKNQIGYCGLWCGSCAVGNGVLKELTERYEHIIKGYGVDKWGAKDFDEKVFMKGLTTIQALPICQGCLKGDGNDECEIRPCALNRKIANCTECNEQTSCKNIDSLRKVCAGALRVGISIKTDNDMTDKQLICKWTTEIKKRFPACIIDV